MVADDISWILLVYESSSVKIHNSTEATVQSTLTPIVSNQVFHDLAPFVALLLISFHFAVHVNEK